MSEDPYAWRAHVAHDWMRHGHRLFLHRRRGDSLELIVGYAENGDPILTQQDVNTSGNHLGLFLPDDAATAIARAVEPGPAQAEISRLEDALAVERGRVDKVLHRITEGT